MAGTTQAPVKAWAAVVLMVVGFTMCAFAFVIHNLIWLWILGGVVGAAGIVMAKVGKLMDQYSLTH